MKFKIGEKVRYLGKVTTVMKSEEATYITYDNRGKNYTLEIYYDLKDEEGKWNYGVREEDIDSLGEYVFENGATYRLSNGMLATYEEITKTVITDKEIEIPGDHFDSRGKNIYCDDFSILEKVEEEPEFEAEDEEEYDDESEETSLTLRDEDHYITFKETKNGYMIYGELPKKIEKFLAKLMTGGCEND